MFIIIYCVSSKLKDTWFYYEIVTCEWKKWRRRLILKRDGLTARFNDRKFCLPLKLRLYWFVVKDIIKESAKSKCYCWLQPMSDRQLKQEWDPWSDTRWRLCVPGKAVSGVNNSLYRRLLKETGKFFSCWNVRIFYIWWFFFLSVFFGYTNAFA